MSKPVVDRQGMIQDVRRMIRDVWRRNNNSLTGAAYEFKEMCQIVLNDLIYSVYCPDLRGLLKMEIDSHSYRCGNCHVMQNGGSPMVWISDGTMMGDPLWAVTEENYNGSGTGWCVPCARKLIRKASK